MKLTLFAQKSRHPRLWVQIGIVVALLAIVLPLRLWRLAEAPPDFYFDEGAHGFDAQRVLAGEHRPFFTTNNGREAMIIYTTAAMIPLLGQSILAVRLPVALAGVGTALAIFWLGQILFRRDDINGVLPARWQGIWIGALAAGLYAVSLGQTILGRTGYRANFLVLLLPLSLGMLWLAMERRSRWRTIVAGALTGLLPYTYISARIVPLLLILLGLAFLWLLRGKGWAKIRSYLPLLALYLSVALLVAAPILLYFARHPADFLMRVDDVSLVDPNTGRGALVRNLLHNLGIHLAAFGFVGDPRLLANLDSRPILNPVEAFFFWIGLGIALFRWQRPVYRLLLIWFGVMLLPAVFSYDWDFGPPNSLRMLSTLPAVFLMIGVGFWGSAQCLAQRVGARRQIIAGAILVAILMVAGQGIITYRSYFGGWVERMYAEQYPSWLDLVKQINGEAPGQPPIYVIPQDSAGPSNPQYNFEFLYQGRVPAYTFHSQAEDYAAKIQHTLLGNNQSSDAEVKSVRWIRQWTADATARIPFLLEKYGRFVREEAYTDYTIGVYTDLHADRPWEFYGWLDPVSIHYDGGISLQAAAIGLHGGEQFPLDSIMPLTEQTLWLVLRWQADHPPHADYWISLRLHDSGGMQLYQRDWGIWDELYTPSSQWQVGHYAESLHVLDLPVELPPGQYELRVVVYDSDTLIPTVEVGSWAAEKTLARLRKGD